MIEPTCGLTEYVETEDWTCLRKICRQPPVAKLKAIIIDSVEHDRTNRNFYVCCDHRAEIDKMSKGRVIWETL